MFMFAIMDVYVGRYSTVPTGFITGYIPLRTLIGNVVPEVPVPVSIAGTTHSPANVPRLTAMSTKVISVAVLVNYTNSSISVNVLVKIGTANLKVRYQGLIIFSLVVPR